MNQICIDDRSSPALLAQGSAFSRFVRGLGAGVASLADGLVTWQRRHRDRLHLMALDDRLLHDIGISLADVEREVSKPFWKP
jgi:uncharacterized protein YjiS (DUF1127 family)